MNSKISKFLFRCPKENQLFYLPEAILLGGLEYSILENNPKIPNLILKLLNQMFEKKKEEDSLYKQLKMKLKGFKNLAQEIKIFLENILKYANSSSNNRLEKFYSLFFDSNIDYPGLFESKMKNMTQIFCASIQNILKMNNQTILNNINVFEFRSNSTSIYELSLILLSFFDRDCLIYNNEDKVVYKKFQLSENPSELMPITIFLNKEKSSLNIVHFEESKLEYYTKFSEEFYEKIKLYNKFKHSNKNHEEEKINDNVNMFERILNKFKEKLISFAIKQNEDTEFISKEDDKKNLENKMQNLYKKVEDQLPEKYQKDLLFEMKDFLEKVRLNIRDLKELKKLKKEFVSEE